MNFFDSKSWAMKERGKSPRSQNAIANTPEACAPPEGSLRSSELNGSLAAYEKLSCGTPLTRHLGARANAIAKAPVHVRGHDETEACRRAGAVAGWQMGCFRLHRCRSGSEHQDFASVDHAGERR